MRRRVRRRVRRWLLGIAIVLIGLVLLVLAALLVIVWVPAASQLAARIALERWDDAMPGEVEWTGMSGSLGAGLRIEGVELRHADARPLVRAAWVLLDLDVSRLLRGEASLERAHVHELEVWVDHDFGALAPRREEPAPEREGYGPDLPLLVHANVSIDGGAVLLGGETLVRFELLELEAEGIGEQAEAELSLIGAELPGQELRVESVALAARWDAPVAVVERLEIDAPLGSLRVIEPVRLDISTRTGAIEIEIEGEVEALADRLGVAQLEALEQATIRVRAEGGPSLLELEAEGEFGPGTELSLSAVGGRSDDESWFASADLNASVAPGLLHAEQGPLELSLDAVLARSPALGFGSAAELQVTDVERGERLAIELAGVGESLSPPRGTARLELRGPGLSGWVEASSDEARALQASASIRVEALGVPLGIVARWIEQPRLAELRGALSLDARCASAPGGELDTLDCFTELELENFAGYDTRLAHARLVAKVSPLRQPVPFVARLDAQDLRLGRGEFVLDTLTLAAEGSSEQLTVALDGRGPKEAVELQARLRRAGQILTIDLSELSLVSRRARPPSRIALIEPAQIVIAPERVEVHDLALSAGGGRVEVDGHLGLAGARSELRLAVAGVELARIDPLVPGPRMRGRVDLRGLVRGRLAQPEGWVWIEGEGLGVGPVEVGELELAANLCGVRGAARAEGRPRELGLAQSIERSPLLGLEPVSMRVGACESGDAGVLKVSLRSEGPLVERAQLAARVPLRFDRGIGLRRGRSVFARVYLRGLDLVALGGLMPDTPGWWRQIPLDAAAPAGEPRLIPEGRVELELAVSGQTQRPEIELALIGRELIIDHTRLGSLLARASLEDARLGVELDLEPGFAIVELDAALPVSLDLAAAKLNWDREAEHTLSLELRALDLAELEATLGPKLPALEDALASADLGGLVSATIRAQGSLSEPRVSARLRAHGLTHRREALGHAWVDLDYEAGWTEARFELDGPLAERLDAHVRLPLQLALDEPRVLEFDTAAPLIVELHVAQADIAKLEPHVPAELPLTGLADLDLVVGGSLAQPELELAGRLAELRHEQELIGDLSVLASVDDSRAQIEADLIRRGTHLVSAAFELPLTIELADLDQPQIGWDREGRHLVRVTARELDAELLSALTGGRVQLASDEQTPFGMPELDAKLQLDLAGGGRLSEFVIIGELHGELLADNQTTLVVDGGVDLNERRQRAALTIAPATCEPLELRGQLEADPARLIAGEQLGDEVRFEVDLRAPNFQLETLAPLIATVIHAPRGTLKAKVSGGGSLSAPMLDGALEISDGELTILALRQRLSEIAVNVSFANELVELRRLSATTGRGSVLAQGRAQISRQTGIDAKLDVSLEDVPIIRPGLPAMAIDGQLDIALEREVNATALRVALADGKVTVAGVNPPAPKRVPSHAAVDFVGAEPAGLDERDEGAADDLDMPDAERFTLHFELSDPLLITGPSIDMAWAGALEVRQRGADVDLEGELEAQRGRLELLGRRFELRRGIVTLPADGSLNPYLDILAETTTPEAEVSVTIRGRATEPTLRFSSSPPLSEIQILTLLVTGSTQIEGAEGEVEAKAASLLAAVSSPALQRQLDQYLGIDRVRIGFGETIDQPILSIGKRLTRDVYVETTYHHNAPEDENTAEVGVEYQLTRRWSLETYFGDAAVGGVGVYWTRSFGAMPWKPKPTK